MENNQNQWEEIKGGEVFSFEQPNDSIEGILVDVRTETGKFKSTAYDIETKNGKVYTIFGSMVLDGRMKKCKVFDRVKIVFKGIATSKEGRKYKDFTVFKIEAKVRPTISDPEPPVTDREEI